MGFDKIEHSRLNGDSFIKKFLGFKEFYPNVYVRMNLILSFLKIHTLQYPIYLRIATAVPIETMDDSSRTS